MSTRNQHLRAELGAGLAITLPTGAPPADLAEAEPGPHEPSAEPLRATPLDVGLDTGSAF